MKGRADLTKLDHKAGGIPETGRINKNREALFWYDRSNVAEADRFKDWIWDAWRDLANDQIDTIIVTAKERTW